MGRKLQVFSQLTDEQKTHIIKGANLKHLLLSEKTGKGKTLIILSIFVHLSLIGKRDKLFVLTPKSAYDKEVWAKECKKHTNILSISFDEVLKKSGGNLTRALKVIELYDLVFFKHTHVKKYRLNNIFTAFKSIVVLDEVHAFRNPSAALTKEMKSNLINVEYVFGITATPLSRDLSDTYNIINLIKPNYLGSFFHFRSTYCNISKQVIGRLPNGKLRTVDKIIGVLNEASFREKLEPIVLTGDNVIKPIFYRISYKMSQEEADIYTKIGAGISSGMNISSEDWIRGVLEGQFKDEKTYIRDIQKHSSRFIYLQYAADGVLNKDGSLGRVGSKINRYIDLVKEITQKGESLLMYFSYYASLDIFAEVLEKEVTNIKIYIDSGKSNIDYSKITEESVKKVPHVILCTKAATESISYYFIKNAAFFHIPTTPDTFTQFTGRITRINSLYKDCLSVYIPDFDNIDNYKLRLVSHKAAQMELVTSDERNIPDFYKGEPFDAKSVADYKKYLLWNNKNVYL